MSRFSLLLFWGEIILILSALRFLFSRVLVGLSLAHYWIWKMIHWGRWKQFKVFKLKAGRQKKVHWRYLIFFLMPDKLLVLLSSLCQTVKLFSNPDMTVNSRLYGLVFDQLTSTIYSFMNSPTRHFTFQWSVWMWFFTLWVEVLCRLCLLLSTYSSSGMRISEYELRLNDLDYWAQSWADCARMMEAWIHCEQITSKVSDLFQIRSHL